MSEKLNKMSKHQEESIRAIVNEIKKIKFPDDSMQCKDINDTNILFACLEVSLLILAYSNDTRANDLSNKLQKIIMQELLPIMGISLE